MPRRDGRDGRGSGPRRRSVTVTVRHRASAHIRRVAYVAVVVIGESYALVHELQRKLDITRRACAGNQAERAALDVGVGSSETRVIRSVEELRAELQLL